MADDQYFETWDEEFLQEAIDLTERAVCSSSSNPTQPPPPPAQLFPPPPPPPSHYSPQISYSPPRELSQRVKEDTRKHFPDKVFDCPVSLNGINKGFDSVPPIPQSSRLHDEDTCSKQKEIDRLKEELGRVSKELTNLEQECLELRKDREKNEKLCRLVPPVNGSKDAEAYSTKKSNLKNKDPIEDYSVIHPGTKGVIPCKAVGVQTDENAISTDFVKKSSSVSRKLACIWEPQNDQQQNTNLVSKLFVGCEADLQVLFGCLGLKIPSEKAKMAPNVQAVEAAQVSRFYLTFSQISYDIGRLDDFLEALVDLCCLQNALIVQRSLCILHLVLKRILSMENRLCSRDNIIVENTNETSDTHHPVLTRLRLRNESHPLISFSKWFSLFQMMHQVVTRRVEENIRVEAVSIMNILLLRTDAYAEREMYGEVVVFQSISQLLRKEAGVGVQKQTVHLLYLLLNCPQLMSMFCSFCKEDRTTAEIPTKNTESMPAFQGSDAIAILDGLADCLACRANGAPITLVLRLQRNVIILLAFLASSGRSGFEVLMGRRRPHFLYLILQILASEIDVESSHPSDDFRERTLLIREALILVNRLASNSQYSTSVLHVLTNRRDMAILTIDIAIRLSRKSNWSWQSDTTRQMRESEIVDLARIFKKRVFAFLGDEK